MMVCLRGMGLSCALGADIDTCVAGLRACQRSISRAEFNGFAEPLVMNYYRIDDGATLLDPGRLANLLPAVIGSALTDAGVTLAQRRAMPVFAGSSCFSIAQSEAQYASALADGSNNPVPLPRVGFQTIVDMAREAAGSGAAGFTWNTACTSSANALLAAQRMLAQGQIEHALVVGVELANLTTMSGFLAMQLIADGVRPFDADRAGIVLGESIGAVVLSTESGGSEMPRLLGGATNCDRYSVTGANPDGSTIAAVQRAALRGTGTQPDRIRAIKAHGTGTPANDAAEARGMRQVYPTLPPLTALKSFIGHTLGACGVAELTLFAGALRHGFIPATAGFETADDAIAVRPLDAEAVAEPGVYQLNHFGFGGNNTVLMMESM